MNLKRHHVLYGLLAVSLIVAVVVLLVPRAPRVSYTPSTAEVSQEIVATTSPVSAIRFEIVTSEAKQELGLGGRASIPENYGMLFVFPKEGSYGFWMKGMKTSIDILWLSDTGKILGVEDSVTPESYTKGISYYPPQPVKYVLEMRAGETRRRGWKVGTIVTLPAPYGLPSSS